MKIVFFRNVLDMGGKPYAVEVEDWKNADQCTIECEDAVELVEAGRWIEAHKRTICEYEVYAAYGSEPYIEVKRKAKN